MNSKTMLRCHLLITQSSNGHKLVARTAARTSKVKCRRLVITIWSFMKTINWKRFTGIIIYKIKPNYQNKSQKQKIK